ncbi:phage holin family protein [Pseudomonas putida]|uniref:Phage holin family protein n=1 Tax=Pseudomonas putida TaxID=303 RepID=A0A7W2KYI7_PSEPU|nr:MULTISPECIES: phage holin family protein [Pseudomonas]MBA6115202.1 phage holin family protein [Pseudomonas putida]MBI6939813.1 phage holin family protein [Pseudomonas putida]MBI6956217.1 phage holin family protein [Pseudomonas putida]MCZ9639385.1 phage holin family protein [Pseudomonas putida]MEC4874670.1 phage holin family protein [Pseudomonas sp. NC26]
MNKDPLQVSPGLHTPADDPVGVGGLLRQLMREVPELFSKELALAKAELQHNLNTLKAGTAAVAAGAIVLLAGLIILLMAGVYALALVVAPWLAALIVGVVTMIIGFIMLQSGKKQFEPSQLTPDRTLHAMQQDKDALKRKLP